MDHDTTWSHIPLSLRAFQSLLLAQEKRTRLPPGHLDVLATLWLCLVMVMEGSFVRVMEEWLLYDNAAASRCLTREHSSLLILGCCQQDRFGILSYKDVNCQSKSCILSL